MNRIKQWIEQGPLLVDGGMGTYFSSKEHLPGSGCEMASIEKPVLISAIHREYLEAGARVIKTNTFAANRPTYRHTETVRRIIRASWNLAVRAAAPFGAEVFADIGPVTGLPPAAAEREYRFIVEEFLSLGAENFLFETNADDTGLDEAAAYIRSKTEDPFLAASFAVLPDGYTRSGIFGEDLIRDLTARGNFDAVGFNCVSGVRQMARLMEDMDLEGVTLSVMPNAGYPTVVGNRTFYDSDPVYFGRGLAEIAARGASIIGGCCGTTPAHIAAAREELTKKSRDLRSAPGRSRSEALAAGEGEDRVPESPFFEKLRAGEMPVAVELDPPETADVRKYMEGAARLAAAGCDLLTIADCPVARARMDSTLLACRVKRDLGMETIPHLTCRDRNLNATKALLLGLSAEGLRNVLVITGDPIPTAERDEVKSVYQFNSRKMAAFIRGLGRKSFPVPFHVFGALNLNARNFDVELRIAREKVEAGMVGFFTQPVLSRRALENLKQARRTLQPAGAYIIGGIIPVVSQRNALFMENEINGIHVSQEIIRRYEGLDRDAAEALALELSVKIAKDMAPFIDGYYLMTPFGRTKLMTRIIAGIRG